MKRDKFIYLLWFVSLALAFAPPPLLAQQAPLIVGVVAPLSGGFSASGNELNNGVNFAADLINERGGIRGRKLEVISKDDQGRPAEAVNQATRLVQVDKASALIGFPTGGSAIAIREVAAKSDVLAIVLSGTPAATAPDFKAVLRPIGREDALARMVVDYVKANFPQAKKIGAWLPRNAPLFAASFQTAAAARRVAIARLDTDTAPGEMPNWSNDFDVTVVSPGVTLDLVRRFMDRNPQSAIVLATAVTREAELALAREKENVRIIANPGPDFFSGTKDIIEQAKSKNISTGGFFIYGYAAMQVFASLAAERSDFSGSALGTAAREKPIPTALGPLKFDAIGDLAGWRFAVWSKSGQGVAAVDVCAAPDCKDYEQCPRDCPTK